MFFPRTLCVNPFGFSKSYGTGDLSSHPHSFGKAQSGGPLCLQECKAAMGEVLSTSVLVVESHGKVPHLPPTPGVENLGN